MVAEEFVTYFIMKFLRNGEWEIVQYHPPGGQAAFAVALGSSVVYIDIVAYHKGVILVIENKPHFDQADIDKLRQLMGSKDAIRQIKEYVTECCRNRHVRVSKRCKLVWGHGFSGSSLQKALHDINLLKVKENGSVQIIASTRSPLVV